MILSRDIKKGRVMMKQRLMALGFVSLATRVCLCGCEDRETVMARCRMEAIRVAGTGHQQIPYARACMTKAGYRYDPAQCGAGALSGNELWTKCYEANSVGTRLAELFSR
jgi:hypothetical protein